MSTNSIKQTECRTKKRFFFSIRSKMMLYFGLIFVLISIVISLLEIYGIPFTKYRGELRRHQSGAFKQLNFVADLKKERLLRWMKERKDDAEVLSKSSLTTFYVANVLHLIREKTFKGATINEFRAELQGVKDHQILTNHLNLVKSAYDVYDSIQIADALTGIIIASTKKEDSGMDISKSSIFTGLSHKSYTNEIIEVDKEPLTGNLKLTFSRIIDIEDEPEHIHAVLIMHINPNTFIKPMLHTGPGLGESGEALLVDSEARILNYLKFPFEDGTFATPLEYQITARPAELAAHGEEGIIACNDYRNKPVLAAYRHLLITSELGWGMVVKRDQKEIFAALKKSFYYLSSIVTAGILIMMLAAYIISNNISRPIKLLSRTVHNVKGGNLNITAEITTSDEVGALAEAFNSMINRLQASEKELLRIERLAVLGKLSSGIAHEIRNPLGVIDSSAYFLKMKLKNADEKTSLHLNRIINQVKNSTDIIQSLQDLVTMKEPLKIKTDIARVIEKGMNISEIPESVKTVINVPKGKLFVDVDTKLISIMLRNIITNAVQAMEDKGTIWITANIADKNWCEISIKDSGPGIKAKDINNIFTPFVGTKAKGFGFGLSICEMVIEKHGGDIKVLSEERKGANLIIRLPVSGTG